MRIKRLTKQGMLMSQIFFYPIASLVSFYNDISYNKRLEDIDIWSMLHCYGLIVKIFVYSIQIVTLNHKKIYR
jgi:hypothetical protein